VAQLTWLSSRINWLHCGKGKESSSFLAMSCVAFSVHNPSETAVTVDEVDIFHTAVNQHVRRCLGLRLEKLFMRRVELPIVKMDAKGKVSTKLSYVSVLIYWFRS